MPGLTNVPLEHDQKVAMWLRNREGIEMTPDQVADVRDKAFCKIRLYAARMGVRLPQDDMGLIDWFKRNR
jgi:hypothetical protein